MIYCSQCGKENADQAKFCSSCGATLNGNVSFQSRPQVQPKAKTMPFKEMTAKRSLVGHYGLGRILLCILFCWLVFPLIILICWIIKNASFKYIISTEKIESRSGIFNTKSQKQIITKVLSVSETQSLGGKIFNYGTVCINLVGKNDFYIKDCKNHKKVVEFFEQMIANAHELNQIVME